ncbi:MAG: T9SS type A sorting domain-containing protein, partial [bacterium]
VETTTSVKEISDDIPISFLLDQNYPNPFNPNTTIQFVLPYSGYVTLKIYNALGEEMTTLVTKNLSAGKHQVVWEAKGMVSGIYFYRLQAADFVQTRKLVFMR